MRVGNAFAVVVGLVCVAGGTVRAGVINVDFNVTDGGNAGIFNQVGAAGAAGGSTWTGLALGAKTFSPSEASEISSFGPSADLDPTVPGDQTLTLTHFQAYDVLMAPDNKPAAFASALLSDYIYNPPGANNIGFTISGLLAGTYDLYLYGQNGGYYSSDAEFTVTGATPSSDTISNSAHASGIAAGFVSNGNYLKFTVVVASDGGSITGAVVGNNYEPFNGFQLVPVPEPTSFAACAAASMLLAIRPRSRKA